MRKWNGYVNTLVLLLAVFMAGCCNNDGNTLGIPSLIPVGPVPAAIPLGAAGTFRVLAGTTVTNVVSVGTAVNGDVGAWAGSTVTGFPPGTVTPPFAIHAGDATAQTAQGALTTAYNAAAAVAPGASVSGNIGGLTLAPGTYTASSSLAISSGDLTLDGRANANAVWIFQIGSTLTVTSGRKVILAGGATAANIYWQVGSSATIGTTADFSGTILSNVSISLLTGATLHGRALARTGAVSLDANVVGP